MSRRPAQGYYGLSTGAAGRERELNASELISVSSVEFDVSSATTAYVAHNLRRSYVGLLVIGQTTGSAAYPLTPEQVTSNGQDPEQVAGIGFGASFTGTVRARVF